MNPFLRTIATAALVVMASPTRAEEENQAPPPPPVNPVSPGTSVNGSVAPVKLDDQTLLAIRQIVQETVRQQYQSAPPPSGQAPYQAPAPSPQGFYQPQAAVYQTPVTPVVMVTHKSKLHRAMGALGAKMANMGQPTVTQGFLQQSVTPVSYLSTQSAIQVPAPATSPTPQMFPSSYQVPVTATPQAPHK